jgi:hypothetical protein
MISPSMVAVAGFIIVACIGLMAWSVARRKRRPELRKRFGPEYEYALQHHLDRRSAEANLKQRLNRMQGVPIRAFRPEEKEELASRWHDLQARFVDDPQGAIREAEALIGEALQARGYPPGSFETQAQNLSVDHPDCVRRYREAHEIANREPPAPAQFEDLRTAFFAYRAVFEELLDLQRVD